MTRRRCTPIQLTLDHARKPTGHGGWRPGAGRPRGRTTISHGARDPIEARHPQHVTLRLADGMPPIRRKATLAVVLETIRIAGHASDFRIVHFNVLSNHIHMLVET